MHNKSISIPNLFINISTNGRCYFKNGINAGEHGWNFIEIIF